MMRTKLSLNAFAGTIKVEFSLFSLSRQDQIALCYDLLENYAPAVDEPDYEEYQLACETILRVMGRATERKTGE